MHISCLPFDTSTSLYEAFQHEETLLKFHGFLDEVLKQIDVVTFDHIIHGIYERYPCPLSNADFYTELRTGVEDAQGYLFPLTQLAALKAQVKELTHQTAQLVENKPINNMVELGSPGAYISSLRHALHIQGKAYAVGFDEESIGQYPQNFELYNPLGYFKSYDAYLPLGNYGPISDIPSNSVDLVVCYIGLHHVPSDKIDAFVQSINRILTPGGLFILRDHDARNADLFTQADIAHSVFNAVADKTPVDIEVTEIRLFKPIDDWVKFVENLGFYQEGPRLLQNGDSTANTLIKFVKTMSSTTIEDITLRDAWKASFALTEWYNVRVANNYAQFITHTPWFAYPFFKAAEEALSLDLSVTKQAYETYGVSAIFSSYSIMSQFITATSVTEYLLKGLLSVPIKWIAQQDNEDRFIDITVRHIDLETVKNINKDIQYLGKNINDDTHLRLPRYLPFMEIMLSLAAQDIHIINVAGNQKIQLEVIGERSKVNQFCGLHALCTLQNVWQLPSESVKVFGAIWITTSDLSHAVKLTRANDLTISYIYDF